MNNQIINLAKEISTFKKTPPSTIIFKCDECGYEASSETVLKRHKTSKHKEHNLTPGKERSTEHDISLQLLMSVDERALVLYSPPQPHNEDHIQITTTFEEKTFQQFKCELCSFASVCSANLQSHLSFTHNPSIPHTSEWDYNKCYICNQVFNTFEFFKNHMIQLHNFSDNSNVCTKYFEPNEVCCAVRRVNCFNPIYNYVLVWLL